MPSISLDVLFYSSSDHRDLHSFPTRRSSDLGIDNYGRCMSQNRRTPAADVIDVFVAIDIPNLRTFRALDKKWLGIDVAKCAHWRVYTAGNVLLRGMK